MAVLSAIKRPGQLVPLADQFDRMIDQRLEGISKAYGVGRDSRAATDLMLGQIVTVARSPEGAAMGNQMTLLLARARARVMRQIPNQSLEVQ